MNIILDPRTTTWYIKRNLDYNPMTGAVHYRATGEPLRLPAPLNPALPHPPKVLIGSEPLDPRVLVWICAHGKRPRHPLIFRRTFYTPDCPEVQDDPDLLDDPIAHPYALDNIIEDTPTRRRREREQMQSRQPNPNTKVVKRPRMAGAKLPYFRPTEAVFVAHGVQYKEQESYSRARVGVYVARCLKDPYLRRTMHKKNILILNAAHAWASWDQPPAVGAQQFRELRDKWVERMPTNYKGAKQKHEARFISALLEYIINVDESDRMWDDLTPTSPLVMSHVAYQKLANCLRVEHYLDKKAGAV